MRRSAIEDQNRYLLNRQREFRIAADVVSDALARLAEVEAVAVIGSVAQTLWKEVPRFSEFRRAGIEVWHECGDLDLAVWVDDQQRLGAIRRSISQPLQRAFQSSKGISVVSHQVDVFLFEAGSRTYSGRLCRFAQCPKGKRECLAPGCGAVPYNQVLPEFKPWPDLLSGADDAMLYRRGHGRLRSALDLPVPDEDDDSSVALLPGKPAGATP